MLQEAKQEQESGSQTAQEEPEQGGTKVAIVAIIAAIAKKMKIFWRNMCSFFKRLLFCHSFINL